LKGKKAKKRQKAGGGIRGMEGNSNLYGHRKMIYWQNLDRLEVVVQKEILFRIPRTEFNLRDQIDRASSSTVANFIEGYYSGSIKEYLRFLGYSKRSLAELQDWGRRTYHKNYISKTVYKKFDDLASKTMFLANRLINSLKLKTQNRS
jgi:four helix bundle protein